MKHQITSCGTGIIFGSQFVDWEGNPVNRDKYEYRYSYDPYVIHKVKDEYKYTVYSDRLYQQEWGKHNNLCEKHFGDQAQYWSQRPTEKIELFLQDFYDKPDLKLVGIMEGCNVSSGYPYWIFMFDCDFD